MWVKYLRSIRNQLYVRVYIYIYIYIYICVCVCVCVCVRARARVLAYTRVKNMFHYICVCPKVSNILF